MSVSEYLALPADNPALGIRNRIQRATENARACRDYSGQLRDEAHTRRRFGDVIGATDLESDIAEADRSAASWEALADRLAGE